MIHTYKFNESYVLLDINSGSVHKISEVVYDVLNVLPEEGLKSTTVTTDFQKELHPLYKKHEEEVVKEALGEIQYLVKQGLIYSPDIDLSIMFKKESENVVKALCLHVIHDCNMTCSYCFAEQGGFEGPRGFMSVEVGKKALDFLLENSGSRRNLEVDFFGGEPLMNFEVVKELVAYGRNEEKKYNKNIRFTITTNGLLLDQNKIDYINTHMENVVLSIDGRPEVNDRVRKTWSGEGTYDLILEKYKNLIKDREGLYYVRGTFTSHNLDFSKDVIHLKEAGFKNISIEPVVLEETFECAITEAHKERILEEYDILSQEVIKEKAKDDALAFFHFEVDLTQGPCMVKRISGCGAGVEYLAITPEGDIYPCHRFVGMESFKLGNLRDSNFENRMKKEFNQLTIDDKEACKTCWAKFYCSGGCHANAYLDNGNMKEPYVLGCELEKKRIECAIGIKACE